MNRWAGAGRCPWKRIRWRPICLDEPALNCHWGRGVSYRWGSRRSRRPAERRAVRLGEFVCAPTPSVAFLPRPNMQFRHHRQIGNLVVVTASGGSGGGNGLSPWAGGRISVAGHRCESDVGRQPTTKRTPDGGPPCSGWLNQHDINPGRARLPGKGGLSAHGLYAARTVPLLIPSRVVVEGVTVLEAARSKGPQEQTGLIRGGIFCGAFRHSGCGITGPLQFLGDYEVRRGGNGNACATRSGSVASAAPLSWWKRGSNYQVIVEPTRGAARGLVHVTAN